MSNFWIINKQNFYTPTLLLFGFFMSIYLFSLPLRDVTNLYQTMYISIILIFSFSLFTFSYYFIQKAVELKKHVYVVFNFFFMIIIAFLIYQATYSLTQISYPAPFLAHFLGANVLLLLQIGVNQKIQYLKTNLFIFYINALFTTIYILEPPILSGLTDHSIRLFQTTAFVIICAELFRAIHTSKIVLLLSSTHDE